MFKSVALAASVALLTLSLAPPAVHAQDRAAHVAMGDREHDARNLAAALAHYEAAIATDSTDYAALWKASRDAVDLGEFMRDEKERTALYRKAERYARLAVSANPADAEGHFALSRAHARNSATISKRDRVQNAADVRKEALAALELEPEHAGALHVMGMWNAEVMRLSGLERFFARKLSGGKVLENANWNDAVRYMERSVAADPESISQRLDLARIYKDVGNPAKAREQLEFIAAAPIHDYNDPTYKQEAQALLKSIR